MFNVSLNSDEDITYYFRPFILAALGHSMRPACLRRCSHWLQANRQDKQCKYGCSLLKLSLILSFYRKIDRVHDLADVLLCTST